MKRVLSVMVSLCVAAMSLASPPVRAADCAAAQQGYWLVASDGGVFTFGDAVFYGSTGGIRLNKPVVGMTQTPTGNGYWLVASDGGVFTFGDAKYYGSTGSLSLVAPVVAIRATPTGNGYWLISEDGGIFTFGDAAYIGGAYIPYYPYIKYSAFDAGYAYDPDTSTYSDAYMMVSNTGTTLFYNYTYRGEPPYSSSSKYVEILGDYLDSGYWIAREDGGVYTFGSYPFYGSAGNIRLQKPIISMMTHDSYSGYWLVASDGGVFSYGSSMFCGSTGGIRLNAPIVDASNTVHPV